MPGLRPWERTHWGFLPTAAASSHSKLRPPRRLHSATPKRTEPRTGWQPATASGSRPAGAGYAGRAARWIGATDAPWWRGAVVTAGAHIAQLTLRAQEPVLTSAKMDTRPGS